MKLNEKCMLDILQYCTDNIHVSANGYTYTTIKILDLPLYFRQYDILAVYYSVKKLCELNYITLDTIDVPWEENTCISDVTYYGHKYLENADNKRVGE